MSQTKSLKTRAFKLALLGAVTIALCGSQSQCVPTTVTGTRSGIEQQWFDKSARPQDDLYRAANGKWLDTASIPANAHVVGSSADAHDRMRSRMLDLFESAAASPAPPGTPMRRLGDFYASYLDVARIDALGASPLKPTFERIDAIRGPEDVAAVLAHLESIGINTLFGFWIGPDGHDTSRRILNFTSFGTTLDDHLYFDEDAYSIEARSKLSDYVARILELSGDTHALTNTSRIVEFEQALAKAHYGGEPDSGAAPIVARTDETYSADEFAALAPHFNWSAYRTAAGLPSRIDNIGIRNPHAVAALDDLLARTSIDTIRIYLKYQYASARATYLSTPFADARFAFYGTTLFGQIEPPPRALSGVYAVTNNILDEAGIEYAKRHFTRAQKTYVRSMFTNLKAAYAKRIAEASWMAPQTRQHALLKLEKMTAQLGAPDDTSGIADYSKLVIARNDLFGNVERAQHTNYGYRIGLLDRPVDKNEWLASSHEIHAHYDPSTNQIMVAAGMLQPPFFYADADDAINYSGLGSIIGHEISHAFDVNGARRDADGNVRDWWTESDREHYRTRTRRLVEQFDAYSPLPGYYINGEQTQAENIADSAGLDAAYRAYQISLGTATAAVIDGFTGAQRFYYGYAQMHRIKMRDSATINYLKTDPHSPGEFRVNGTVRNQQGFYDAFGVKATDKLYLPPGQRFTLW